MKANYLCRNSIAMAIALTAIATGTQAATSYTITPLGTDEIGLSGPVPTAISSSGFVTGSAFNLDSYNAVIWDTSGNPQLLFPNTTSESFAIDINAANQVLIDPYLIWDKGVVTSLAAGNNGATIIGGQINDTTQLSFTRLTLVNGQYLYRASRADYSSAIELGVLPGQTQSWANNLNNSGDVVGYSYTTSYIETRATLWRNGTIIDVGVLSGQTNSTATDINDNGRIVGTSGGRLFTWENGVMSDLGTISTGAIMKSRAINNNGEIVGSYTPSGGGGGNFLWSNGVFTDLNPLTGYSNIGSCDSLDINDAGQILLCSLRLTPAAPASDLIATISAPSSAVTGVSFSYTATVKNVGALDSTNVIFNSALPANAAFYSVTTSQGICSGTSTVTCSLNTLVPGASATVQIAVTPNVVGPLTLAATATGSEVEHNTLNNSSARNVNVSAPTADMSASMTGSASTIKRNYNLTYTINVKNNGPVSASGVTVTDTLPSSMKFVSASTTQGSCSGTTSVTCSLGTMANGASATVKIVVQARNTGTYTNTAKVSSTTTDSVSSNNTTSVSTTVN